MWKADKADRPSGIPFARNLPWAIVRGRFDKLPNNCQMLENNKVGADTRKNQAGNSWTSQRVCCFCVQRVYERLFQHANDSTANFVLISTLSPLRTSVSLHSGLCALPWRVRTWIFWKFHSQVHISSRVYCRDNIGWFVSFIISDLGQIFPSRIVSKLPVKILYLTRWLTYHCENVNRSLQLKLKARTISFQILLLWIVSTNFFFFFFFFEFPQI